MSNRLGVYTDDVYLLVEDDSGARISSDRSFLLFAYQVGQHFDELLQVGGSLGCGTPIVATASAASRAPSIRAGAGLLVPPGDAVALADAVERLIDDPELCRQLVAHGLDLVRGLTLEAEGARVAKFVDGPTEP